MTEEVKLMIEQWIAEHIPEWKDMQVVTVLTYLGFRMGPLAHKEQWPDTIEAWEKRVTELAALHL